MRKDVTEPNHQLISADVTGDNHQYGVVTSASSRRSSGYERQRQLHGGYRRHGSRALLHRENPSLFPAGQPVQLVYSGTKVIRNHYAAKVQQLGGEPAFTTSIRTQLTGRLSAADDVVVYQRQSTTKFLKRNSAFGLSSAIRM